MTVQEGLGLDRFNGLQRESAEALLLECCSSLRWARQLADGRPYASLRQLTERADVVLAGLEEDQVDEALAGHPRIGERAGAGQADASAEEQSGLAGADDELRAAMAEGNRAYEEKFGHVYLVCATGRSGEEMLTLLQERLRNDPATERRVLRAELAAINRLRLARLVGYHGEKST